MNVSVALCTHNGATYIEAQLRSIFEQTKPPQELIVSDDASSDETLAIVRRVAAEYVATHQAMRVIVLSNESALGIVGNFERAILATSGDLVALCDQDDVWAPHKLDLMTGLFTSDAVDATGRVVENELLLVHSNATLVDGDGESLGATLFSALGVSAAILGQERRGAGFALLMRRNIVTGATVLFHRKLLAYALPFPRFWVHDEWLAVVATAVARIDVCEEELIEYRQHGSNQIGASTLTMAGRWSRLTRARNDRNLRLLNRARILVTRLHALGSLVDPDKIKMAQNKVLHEEKRSALPAARLLRLLPILGEVRTGRYSSMGSGANDILRDLVQPAVDAQKEPVEGR